MSDLKSFCIDRSSRIGKLIFPHEVWLTYDYVTKEWHGSEIDSDGWAILPESEVTQLVTDNDLYSKL